MQTPDPILSNDGKFWIDPLDGRTVPVVRGGDGPEGEGGEPPAGDAPPSAAAGAPAAGSDAAVEAAEEATTSPAAAAEHGFASVDEAVAELKKVRAEAASRRVALKDYDSAFEGYDDSAKAQLLEIAKGLADPNLQPATAKRLKEIAERIEASQSPTTPTGEPDPDQAPLTKAEWKRLEKEREEAQTLEAGIKAIETEARSLGYEPDSARYAMLLFEAQNPEVSGDLTKADERVKAYESTVIEGYRKSVQEGSEKWPGVVVPGSGTGAADVEGGAPKSFSEARKAALARLTGRPGK